MQDEDAPNKLKTQNSHFTLTRFAPLIILIVSLIITFLVSGSGLDFPTKIVIFLIITAVGSAIIYLLQNRQNEDLLQETSRQPAETVPENIFSPDIEEKLLALEEANTIFGTTLKSADMFRLVSNRINEIIPFATVVMFLAFEDEGSLKSVYSSGKDSSYFADITIREDSGLAGKAFRRGQSQFDHELKLEKSIIPIEAVQNLKSGIACPLLSDGKSYGILALYSDQEQFYGTKSVKLLDAVSERLSPLFIKSITFERSLNNALVDSLTNLPNERALFFVLENQIAESQRLPGLRPLTILSMDIQGFTGLNKNYGHATGDRILKFTADNIKAQLRQMDILSRVIGDEFLAVLPTSSDQTTRMIIERIEKIFAANPFIIAENEETLIKLHFGSASFMTDGETTNELLKIARVRKQETKSPIKSTILWFPKDYSN